MSGLIVVHDWSHWTQTSMASVQNEDVPLRMMEVRRSSFFLVCLIHHSIDQVKCDALNRSKWPQREREKGKKRCKNDGYTSAAISRWLVCKWWEHPAHVLFKWNTRGNQFPGLSLTRSTLILWTALVNPIQKPTAVIEVNRKSCWFHSGKWIKRSPQRINDWMPIWTDVLLVVRW